MPWTLKKDAALGSVVVVFTGRLTKEEGEASAHAFREAVESEPTNVEWDLRQMTGYDSGARTAWQKHLWPVRDKLQSVRVVGGNGLVRLGATTLGLALGIPISFADDEPT